LATETHREGLIEDLQEHFGPKVHAASVVEIIEVAQTNMAVGTAPRTRRDRPGATVSDTIIQLAAREGA
jgi:hypothetical protein